MLDGHEFDGLNEEEVVKRLMEMSDADLPPIGDVPLPESAAPADDIPQEMFTKAARQEAPPQPSIPSDQFNFQQMSAEESQKLSSGESDTDILRDIRSSIQSIQQIIESWGVA